MPRTKTAKEKSTPRMAADSMSPGRKINKNNSWRKHGGVSSEFQGIQVFAAVDPYSTAQRKEFKSAFESDRSLSRIASSPICFKILSIIVLIYSTFLSLISCLLLVYLSAIIIVKVS